MEDVHYNIWSYTPLIAQQDGTLSRHGEGPGLDGSHMWPNCGGVHSPTIRPHPPQLGHTPPQLGRTPPQLGHTPPQLGRTPPQLGRTPPQLGRTPPQLDRTPPQLGHTERVGNTQGPLCLACMSELRRLARCEPRRMLNIV